MNKKFIFLLYFSLIFSLLICTVSATNNNTIQESKITSNEKLGIKKIFITANLSIDNSSLSNKKVYLKYNNKTYSKKTNSKGICKFTIKTKQIGIQRYILIYYGNNKFSKTETTKKIKIRKNTLVSKKNSSYKYFKLIEKKIKGITDYTGQFKVYRRHVKYYYFNSKTKTKYYYKYNVHRLITTIKFTHNLNYTIPYTNSHKDKLIVTYYSLQNKVVLTDYLPNKIRIMDYTILKYDYKKPKTIKFKYTKSKKQKINVRNARLIKIYFNYKNSKRLEKK